MALAKAELTEGGAIGRLSVVIVSGWTPVFFMSLRRSRSAVFLLRRL